LDQVDQWCGVHRLDPDERMHHPLILHHYGKLHQHAARGGHLQQSSKIGIVQLVSVIVRVQPDAGHAMNVSTAAQLLLPVRKLRID
jgi:hypothetical protein